MGQKVGKLAKLSDLLVLDETLTAFRRILAFALFGLGEKKPLQLLDSWSRALIQFRRRNQLQSFDLLVSELRMDDTPGFPSDALGQVPQFPVELNPNLIRCHRHVVAFAQGLKQD